MTSVIGAARMSVACVLLCGALPAIAGAQTAEPAPAPQASSQGPLVLERIESGVVFAPDVKITDIDGDVGTLIGGYAGWLHSETFLIGGAGYWLVDGPGDLDMAYGGLLVGWSVNAGSRIRFGVRGLLGGGQADVSDTFTYPGHPTPRPDMRPGHGYPSYPAPGASVHMRWSDTFLIFEPQGVVTLRLFDRVGLDLGVGYRVIGADDYLNDRLRGVTGSIAIRFGH